jgi:hypothetical protein
MTAFRALSLVLISVIVAACSGGGGGKAPPSQVRQVKGDPYIFVQGTLMNGTNSIPESFFAGGEDWMMRPRGSAEEPPEQPKGSPEEGNEAPDPAAPTFAEVHSHADPASEAEETMDQLTGRFVRIGERSIYKNRHFQINFTHNAATGTVQLAGFSVQGSREYIVGTDVRVLHSSYKDGAFSILVHSSIPGDRFVYDLLFTKGGPLPSDKFTLDNFYYLLGKGLKLAWPQNETRTITLCGFPGNGSAQAFDRGVRMWQPPLRDRLDLRLRQQGSCPPFSDLSTQTVTYVSGWIEVAGEQAVAAFTNAGFDFEQGQIVDSDIFFLREEFQEILDLRGIPVKVTDDAFDNRPEIVSMYTQTMAHELGHLLGLHHQFDGTPSIMSYDDIGTLQRYDVEAIQALYPMPLIGGTR